MTELKFENMTAAASGDRQNMLGKLLYFSLPSVLVDKDDLRQLCVDMNIPYAGGNRLSVSDAFRSATGDVRDRIISEEYGERRIYQIYCRDNRRISDSVISRELVKETMHQETNQYEKLANISYDKDSQIFSYDNLAYFKERDPNTCLTETAIRTLLRNGAVPCARVGKKYLVAIEALEIYLAGSLSKNTETPPLNSGGRRWAIR